ncbi:HNH endonuclease [Promicromonospora sp. NPDC050880]|uniref:HNH endonuclease n=1 Tax=Promicromonospora sp. NPDC050880 TaxID=3364406 RepID=UPI00379A01BD
MVDDQLPVNAKTRKLTAPVLAGDLRGAAAGYLWTLAGASTQASLTDGLLSLMDLATIMPHVTLVQELAGLLVDAGFWHAPGHACEVCAPVPDGHWRFHDWFQMKYDPAEIQKLNRRKRAELAKPEIVHAVWARDALPGQWKKGAEHAACRYCGKTVKRKDTRSPEPDRGTIDHVDPMKASGVRNLVVACKGCNGSKGKRTPVQAGMTLRPAPRATELDPLTPTEATSAAETPVSPDFAPPAAVSTAVSPVAGSAAETPVSPEPPAAETAPSPHELDPAQRPPTRPETDQVETGRSSSPQKSLRARVARGNGSGDGSSPGLVQGQGEGSPPASPSGRRKRRRGKGGRKTTSPAPNPSAAPPPSPAPTWDAGDVEVVPQVDRFGSPWHGWRGPASPLGDEHLCSVHGLPEPCRKCNDEMTEALA